jgi:hypothetical protein
MIMKFKNMRVMTGLLALIAAGIFMILGDIKTVPVVKDGMDYRVFVAGLGTVQGKWCGQTGIAIMGLETRPASEKGNELKVIDLLIANSGEKDMIFNSEVSLVDSAKGRYGINGNTQPEVVVRAGMLSQGIIIISVPKGIPDSKWTLESKGGNLKDTVILPLKVQKVTGK